MKAAFIIPALVALGITSAVAAPVVTSASKPHVSENVQDVDYRPYRHCHRRHGHTWCHGGYSYYDYGPGPGIILGFGHFGHHHGGHHGGHHGHHGH